MEPSTSEMEIQENTYTKRKRNGETKKEWKRDERNKKKKEERHRHRTVNLIMIINWSSFFSI